jgi:hypothetical protein
MALATVDLLSGVKASCPPLSVVFADWRQTALGGHMAAFGGHGQEAGDAERTKTCHGAQSTMMADRTKMLPFVAHGNAYRAAAEDKRFGKLGYALVESNDRVWTRVVSELTYWRKRRADVMSPTHF